MTTPAPAPPRLPDRFQIEQEIGRGGMATVYRAHDRHLDRYVAIKVLSADLSHSVGAGRFQREIALMAKLVHPGIVALFDSGEVEGRLYYVMPFVAGENLRTRLVRERRMSPADAASLGADVAEALAYAHGAGIVHRDVKPENIFSVGGRAVLADFGIAHIAGEGKEGLTSAGTVLGTVAYMSPEQATGEHGLDSRSDLYSLGCVLYEMVTGEPPFTAATAMGVLGRHLTEMPKPPRERNTGLSAALDDIIMRLLAKEPGRRPATAGEVARLLRAAAPSGETMPVAAAPSSADRLVDDAVEALGRSASAGPAAKSHLDQSRAYLDRALAQQPKHARALSALASWHFAMSRRGFLPVEEAHAKGRELVLDALAADDRCGDVYLALGRIAFYYDDDIHAARRHADRAVGLDPGQAEALHFQSIVYKTMGRNDEAIRIARRLTELSPGMPTMWNSLGDRLLAAGRNAEAAEALKRAVALQPGYGPALERLELAHIRLGEADLAAEIRASRLRSGGRGERAELLMRDVAEVGPAEAFRRDVRRELDELLAQAEREDPFEPPYYTRTNADQIVTLYAVLGEWKEAMDWVEKSYQRRPVRLRRLLTEPLYDRRGLAADPRYARLLRIAVLEDLM